MEVFRGLLDPCKPGKDVFLPMEDIAKDLFVSKEVNASDWGMSG